MARVAAPVYCRGRGGTVGAVSVFDRYVVVDWSAANRPRLGTDSIWICCLGADGACLTRNPPTRGRAKDVLRDLLVSAVGRRERVLAGFDFPYGYPAGLAAALGLDGAAWRAIWDLLLAKIADDPAANENNRFEVADDLNRRLGAHAAFWGRPRGRILQHLPSTRAVTYRANGTPGGLAQWRAVEQLLRERGRWPHPAWKLLGTGCAGSQTLTGIPVVAALRADPALAAASRVWPFEVTSAELPVGEPAVIHAEVWPSVYDFRPAAGTCKDEKQVRHLAGTLRGLDRDGALAGMMRRVPAPAREEGWILGVEVP